MSNVYKFKKIRRITWLKPNEAGGWIPIVIYKGKKKNTHKNEVINCPVERFIWDKANAAVSDCEDKRSNETTFSKWHGLFTRIFDEMKGYRTWDRY